MTTQAFWGNVMGTLLVPVTIDDLSAPNATVTGERGRGMGGREGEKGMLCVARGALQIEVPDSDMPRLLLMLQQPTRHPTPSS